MIRFPTCHVIRIAKVDNIECDAQSFWCTVWWFRCIVWWVILWWVYCVVGHGMVGERSKLICRGSLKSLRISRPVGRDMLLGIVCRNDSSTRPNAVQKVDILRNQSEHKLSLL